MTEGADIPSLPLTKGEIFRDHVHELVFFTDCARKLGAVQTTLVWKSVWLHHGLIDDPAADHSIAQIKPLLETLQSLTQGSPDAESCMTQLLAIVDQLYRDHKAWEFKLPQA